MTPDQIRLSRRISRVLRHAPESAGLTLDPNGWVAVADLLAALRIDRRRLDAVVAGNDKQRFAVEAGPAGDRIRASQGHSARVGIDLGLAPATPPELLYHGTAAANLPSIRATGLRPGRRQHVHLSADVATAERVGRRHSADIVILTVRAGELARAGHVFHRSANGVWLTGAVPATGLDRTAG